MFKCIMVLDHMDIEVSRKYVKLNSSIYLVRLHGEGTPSCRVRMPNAQWTPCWSKSGSGWDSLTPYVFLKISRRLTLLGFVNRARSAP